MSLGINIDNRNQTRLTDFIFQKDYAAELFDKHFNMQSPTTDCGDNEKDYEFKKK